MDISRFGDDLWAGVQDRLVGEVSFYYGLVIRDKAEEFKAGQARVYEFLLWLTPDFSRHSSAILAFSYLFMELMGK